MSVQNKGVVPIPKLHAGVLGQLKHVQVHNPHLTLRQFNSFLKSMMNGK
jgi:hypothetical protein